MVKVVRLVRVVQVVQGVRWSGGQVVKWSIGQVVRNSEGASLREEGTSLRLGTAGLRPQARAQGEEAPLLRNVVRW